jgi:hypothetical protein
MDFEEMNRQTVGLALIAKDEEDVLPALLDSIDGAFDQVMLDTGSSDATKEIFETWCSTQALRIGWTLEDFQWVDDFAVARNAADEL